MGAVSFTLGPSRTMMRRALRCSALPTLLIALTLVVGTRATYADSADGDLPRPDLLDAALAAYHRVEATGLLQNQLLTIIDYSLPSTARRLWVMDAPRRRVLFHEFVAHGSGSAAEEQPEWAVQFGNEPESRRSSLGTFLTGETYTGTHGHSLELIGLDPGLNDRAFERRIVMHPAPYVSATYRALKAGRVGRSWGCPALDPAVAASVIDRIQEGSVVYVAGPTGPPPAARPVTMIARADTGKASRRATTIARANPTNASRSRSRRNRQVTASSRNRRLTPSARTRKLTASARTRRPTAS